MYKKILVPIDGSQLSVSAAEGAAKFADPLGAEVVLMTVIEPYSYTNISEYRPESIDEYDQRVKAQARDNLDEVRQFFEDKGINSTICSIKSFSPSEAIMQVSEELECDLIFMASHGRKGLAAVLLGSETQKVLTHSKLPVVVYR